MSQLIDLTGQRFGRLTVISRAENYVQPSGQTKVMWKCKCDCGQFVTIRGYSLVHGRALSCGCLQREKTSEANKKCNQFRVDGDLVFVSMSNTDKKLICDKDIWFNCAMQFCWSLSRVGYAFARNPITKKPIYFHSLVLPNCPKRMVIDHIDGDRLRCTRSNIRFVSRQQNTHNQILERPTQSGRVGVNWNKNRKKWRACIKVDGKDIHLGYFPNLQDAIAAREQAEIKYFGEYRRKR